MAKVAERNAVVSRQDIFPDLSSAPWRHRKNATI
jgi:hypothetical protein